MKTFQNILFDLDGTIINPEEGILNSIKHALNRLEIKCPKDEDLKKFIGPPLIDSFSSHFNLSNEKSIIAVNFYREYYSTKGVFQNTLYDGIREVLESLHQKKYQLFIATSKPTIFAYQIISNFKLDHLFSDIAGSNLDHTRNDKSEIIDFLIKSNKLNPTKSIMIGDTFYDIVGAKNNKIKSIGVTYGFGKLKELESADFLASNCKNISEILIFKALPTK